METKNLEADQRSFEIKRDNEYARLEQEREVEMRRAKQASEIAREQAERMREADSARIDAKMQVDAQQVEADRAVEEARIAQKQALDIARQEQQIAVQNKSREESQARALADEARAKAVAAEEQVATSRDTEVAERLKRIELIEASKAAERDAIRIKVDAEAEKDAAVNRAEAARSEAEGQADAAKLHAEADRVRFEVEAAGQRAVNEAANLLSMDQISLQTKLALLKVLPELVRESAKPLEAIDSIKIVQVDGLTQRGGSPDGEGGGSGGGYGRSGNLANDAVAAALSYRAQAPVIDGLMKELGLDGSSLAAWSAMLPKVTAAIAEPEEAGRCPHQAARMPVATCRITNRARAAEVFGRRPGCTSELLGHFFPVVNYLRIDTICDWSDDHEQMYRVPRGNETAIRHPRCFPADSGCGDRRGVRLRSAGPRRQWRKRGSRPVAGHG